jgi:hypothetical protein
MNLSLGLSWACAASAVPIAMASLLGLASPAQAQSGYTMTALKSAPTYQRQWADAFRVYLDDQNRTLMTLSYYEGYKLKVVGTTGGFFPRYGWVQTWNNYPVRYPASTAASVSATKLSTRPGFLQLISPNGNYYYKPEQAPPVNAAGKVLFAGPIYASVMNDAGQIAGVLYEESRYPPPPMQTPLVSPALWSADGTQQVLPMPPGYVGGNVIALTSKGEAVGEVYATGDLKPAPVRWTSAGAELLSSPPGLAGAALAISEQGHILKVAHDDFTLTVEAMNSETNRPITSTLKYGVRRYVVSRNGQDQALTCPNAAMPLMGSSGMSASGVVIGRCAPVNDPWLQAMTERGYYYNGEAMHGSGATILGQNFTPSMSRGFIWRDGVMSDLTDYLKAKGVKLPAGTVFTSAVAINAKGSMVAEYFDAAGNYSVVLLTAKP